MVIYMNKKKKVRISKFYDPTTAGNTYILQRKGWIFWNYIAEDFIGNKYKKWIDHYGLTKVEK